MLKIFTSLFYNFRLSLFILLLLNVIAGQAQTTITQWNFNSSSMAPSTGTGTLALIGGTTSTYAAGAQGGGASDKALNTSNYPAQGTAAKSAGIAITVNTLGFNYIHLKFFLQHSATAAKKVVVQYYNGSTWQDVSPYTVTVAGSFLPQMDIDLSAYPAINNNAIAQLRLVTDFSTTNAYEPVSSANYNAGTGTIRYDLITVTGNTLTCVGPATQQASGLRLLKTDATSAQLTLNRGNGGGCLVLCSNSGIPSPPANNMVYVANASFGNGTALGNGFAVYNTQVSNPAIQYFNITNLVAGTKYYLAAYEYSSGGNCYLPTAFVDSFYCNSTVLYPGDVQFVGYDNNVAGKDFFVLTNFTELKKGTTLNIVNSRFEAGALVNERTNRWYAGGSAIHDNMESIELLYTATKPLDSGKIISLEFINGPTGSNILVNGISSPDFVITSKNISTGFSMLSSSNADQFFLTQGSFRAYGILNIDQYYLLNGYVLHGISYTNPWVSINQAAGIGVYRESRIPPDILGLNLFFNTNGFAYYNLTAPHAGLQNLLLTSINNVPTNWTTGNTTNTNQINSLVPSAYFTPSRMNVAGTWTGNANDNNWFNYLNWENLKVPDSLTDVNIAVGKASLINANAPFAVDYNKTAKTRALAILGMLTMSGNGSDKLIVYDSLLVDIAGQFSAYNINSNDIDTIILKGNLERRNSANVQAFEKSFLSFEGNPTLRPNYIRFVTGTIYTVRTLSINNLPGVLLLNGGMETAQQLELTNGVLSVIEGPAIYYLSQNCNIVSPVTNNFGENKGWEKSFIDGRVNIRTNNLMDTLVAPVGSAAKNVFAPMVFVTNDNTDPDAPSTRIYSASYSATSHPKVSTADISIPPFNHVSELEYWVLNSTNPAAAKITLYYTPYSKVGGGGNPDTALLDLRVAQYWDSLAPGGKKWRLPGSGFHSAGPNINYGKVSYNDFVTDLSFSSDSFTLGTVSRFNTLPVQLLTWSATPQSKQVRLTWQVADESDVNFYNIEKSIDGIHYTSLQKINKAITSNSYTLYDTKPAEGWNYYRLKATGTDGKIFYSDIRKVWFATGGQWLVYPNPATDVLWLQLPVAGIVTLYNMDGKIVLQRRLPALLNKLPVQSFTKGLYLLEYFDGKKRLNQKINLQ